MELSVENLIKSFNKRVVVDEVSLHITKKEIVGLLGPNGAGKSTIFYMMVGFLKPLSGNIYLNGENITSLPMHKRARMGLGYLPQQPSIFRNMSVQDNIIAVLELRKDLNKKQMHEICDNLLEEFSISHLRKQSGHTLSGGERRRVEIARAL
ncbi:MAG TPA: ATP-binding cassette domain-containing protein, partial [Exilispira sp.]|nr:ATP-binding cassette domain-containing protein [Exilispira sp.]